MRYSSKNYYRGSIMVNKLVILSSRPNFLHSNGRTNLALFADSFWIARGPKQEAQGSGDKEIYRFAK